MLNLIEQLLIEGRQTCIAITLLLSIDIHQEDTFPPETWIDIQKVLQGPHKQTRPYQKHQ